MNRLSRGESSNKVLSNAQEEVEAKKKKEQERKRIEGIKNLSSKLQRMTDLSRENRKRFMKRLNRGESSNKILSNAQKEVEAKKKKEQERKRIEGIKNLSSKLQRMTDLSRENRKRFMKRLNRGESSNKILSNAQKEVERKKKQERDMKFKNLSSKLQSMTDLSRENRKRFMKRLNRGESSNKILSNAQKEVERKKKQERDMKFKNLSSKLQSMKNLTRENRKRYMNRLSRGEDPQKILSNARKNITNKKRKENVRKMWNKKKQNLNQRSKQPAINRIQRMRGLGVENKQMYIRRIKESKNVDKILREASKRNVILRL